MPISDVIPSGSAVRADPAPRGRCKCGYDLRGIDSDLCPECGRLIEIDQIPPKSVVDKMTPVFWPANFAFASTMCIVGLEVVYMLPVILGLFLLLVAFALIMSAYWWRSHWFWRMSRKYKVSLKPSRTEFSMVWRARRWFAIGVILTFFSVPQILAASIDLPWLNADARRLYESEPLRGPHRLHWCGLNPVTGLSVHPSGVYFYLGMRSVAYCPEGHSDYLPRSTFHIWGTFWYVDMEYEAMWDNFLL